MPDRAGSIARAGFIARAALAAQAALIAGAALVGCAEPNVVRVVDGREIEGRFISSTAYALYAIAADAEAHGNDSAALMMYTEAASEDSDSPEIWTRVGALRCKLRKQSTGSEPYAEAFDKARELDPEYEPLAREEAICAQSMGRTRDALALATRAVELDPSREETGLLHAQLLEGAGRVDEARREIRALTVRRPTSAEAWRALRDLSLRAGDRAAADQASDRLSKLASEGAASAARAMGPASLSAIDVALAADDLEKARKLGRAARVAPSELAVRAAALGRYVAAREQAELVLGADPAEASARIALAVAADLSGDPARFSAAFANLPPSTAILTPPSPLARLLFAELLDRRAGLTAARAWLGPTLAAGAAGKVGEASAEDPLLQRVEARIRQRFGA